VLKAPLDRPTLLDHAANSLPSGHVAAVTGVAAAVTLVTSPATRLFVALTGLTAVALTGVATLALRRHRPSDVIASVMLAVAVAAMTHVMATLRRARAGCARAAGDSDRVG
jgi:membrane-associated phospholipid phosphatase